MARLRRASGATRVNSLGLNEGSFASARISPVRASSMTTEPDFAWCSSIADLSSRYAKNCRRRSRLSARSFPNRGAVTYSTSLIDSLLPFLSTQLASLHALQFVVERELRTFLTLIVDVRDADDVRRRLTCRVVASVLALEVHAVEMELFDLLYFVRRDSPLHEHELALRVPFESCSRVRVDRRRLRVRDSRSRRACGSSR